MEVVEVTEPEALTKSARQLGITEEQAAILCLLAEYRALTTGQIWQAAQPNRHRRQTLRNLDRLRACKFVDSMPLQEERGAASEHVWRLLKAGAEAVGARHGNHFYRKPAPDQVVERGVELELERQVLGTSIETKSIQQSATGGLDTDTDTEAQVVEATHWELIKPVHYGRQHPLPHTTPQEAFLIEAVLYSMRREIETSLERGFPMTQMQSLIDKYNARQVGSIVPRRANDYVAYVPGRPELTAVLIAHPPRSGKQFWTRSPSRNRLQERKAGRLATYKQLANRVPVAAVFSDRETAQEYKDVIRAAGLRVFLPHGIGAWLCQIMEENG